MDFSGSETYDDVDSPGEGKRRGCFGRLARFLLLMLGLAVLCVALFAFLLTTDLGRLWLLGRINRAIAPAHLSVEGWDVPFFGAAALHEVEYESPDDGLNVKIKNVELARGVFALIPLGKLALGEITLDSPVVVLDAGAGSGAVAGRKAESSGAESEGGGFFLPVADAGGTLKVKNGSALLRAKEDSLFQAEGIEGQLIVDSLWKPFGFEIKGRAGGGSFSLSAELQSIMTLTGEGVSGHADKLVLQLERVDVSALKHLFVRAGSPVLPQAGVAEGAVTFERSIEQSAYKVEGGMLVDELRLATGKDYISPAGNVALLIDVDIKQGVCGVRKFEVSSPWGRAKIGGVIQKVQDNRLVSGDVDADIDVDVAAVTRDFRGLLGIKDEFKFTGGRLAGVLSLKGEEKGVDLRSSLKMRDWAMVYGGRSVTLERDPALTLNLFLAPESFPEISELRFSSSFADIYGKGNIRQGVLKGYVDLSRFSADFRGLLREGTVLGGAAHFNLATTPAGEDTAFDFIAKLSRLDITSSEVGATTVKEGSLTFNGRVAGAQSAKRLSDLSFHDVDFDLRVEKSKLHGKVSRFIPVQNGEKLPVIRGFAMSSELLLADAVRTCGAFMRRKAFLNALENRGSVLMNAAAESANGIAKVRVNGAGRDIEFKAAGKVIREPDLRFGGALTFRAEENSLTVSELEIKSNAADVSVPEWYVKIPEDGSQIQFRGSADAELDVAVIYPFVAAGTDYDQVRGNLNLGVTASGSGSATDVAFRGVLSDYYMLADKEIVFFEKRAELKGVTAFVNGGSDASIKTLSLYSGIADISAEGSVRDIWGVCEADLKGEIDLKFSSIEKLLRVRGIDEWSLTGNKRCPYRLKGPLKGAFLQSGSFTGGAYLASLSGLGMNAGGAGIDLDLQQGRLACEWTPALNGGQLRLHPEIDFSARGSTVSLPAGEQMLENVKITQAMVDKLLVHFNPLFHGSQVRSGTISLKVNQLVSGPRPGHADLVADAECSLDNVEMTLSPAMRDLLGMIKVKDRVYRVQHLPMHVTVRNERVYLEPVTMVFSDQPVVFSGSVGFDSTVNYLVEIPLGEAITRKTGIPLPGGLSVKVPVTGTIDNPRLDTQALEKALGGFIRNTLGEEALKGVNNFLEQLKKELK